MRQDGGRAWLTIPDDFSLPLDELHLTDGAHLALQPNDNRNRDFVVTIGRFVGTADIHDRWGFWFVSSSSPCSCWGTVGTPQMSCVGDRDACVTQGDGDVCVTHSDGGYLCHPWGCLCLPR